MDCLAVLACSKNPISPYKLEVGESYPVKEWISLLSSYFRLEMNATANLVFNYFFFGVLTSIEDLIDVTLMQFSNGM